MTISKEILDEPLQGVERPEDLLGDAGLMKELKIILGLIPSFRLNCESEACPSRDIALQCPAGQWIAVLLV